MDMVLGEIGIRDSEVSVHIDEILTATKTLKRHYEVLELVSTEANLKLGPQKCGFFKNKVSFLGHVINQKG